MSIERSSTAGCRIIIILWFLLASLEQWSPQHTHEEKKHLALQIQEQFCGGAPFGSNIKRLSLEVSTPLECEYANVFLSKACGKEIATASNC